MDSGGHMQSNAALAAASGAEADQEGADGGPPWLPIDEADRKAVQQVHVKALHPSPLNPRKRFDEDELQELATSIAKLGIIEPLIVRPGKGPLQNYEIIAGERRW